MELFSWREKGEKCKRMEVRVNFVMLRCWAEETLDTHLEILCLELDRKVRLADTELGVICLGVLVKTVWMANR